MIIDRLRKFIINDLGWSGDAALLTDTYQLVENGVIDSLGVFELLQMMEEEFDLDIDDDELTFDNFESLAALASMVGDKQSSPA